MKKRLIGILLTLCVAACAVSPVMSYADPGVSASGSSAYGARSHPTQPHLPDGQRMKATRTERKKVSRLPSPRGMSR